MPALGNNTSFSTLIRREIDRAIDVDRQIGVHLNHTVKISLVPIVTAPRFIGHVLNDETLVRRKFNVRQSPGAAFLDRSLKHVIEFVFRNYNRLPPFLVTLPQGTVAWNFRLELANYLVEVRIW